MSAPAAIPVTDTKKIVVARREVDRLRLKAQGAGPQEVAIWEAANKVSDLQAAARSAQVRAACRAGRLMDLVLAAVAVLTMAFSLQNIHGFAAAHQVGDPIGWFLAPAVDLALIAALTGDAVLSRKGLTAGVWATRLRWYAGGATLLLNSWESWASVDPAAIVVHTIPPTLLFVLAEAASPYRVRFAETVRLAAEESADRRGETAGRLWGDSAPDLQESADRLASESATRVPTPARAGSRPHRTVEELVGEARRLPAGKQTADGIRVALRVGARRAREVRDVLAAGKQTPPGAVLNDAA